MSWKDEYIFIDTNSLFPVINIQELEPEKTKINTIVNQITNSALSYLDISETMVYAEDDSAICDFETQFKFNSNPSNYNSTFDYTNSTLLAELDDVANLIYIPTFNTVRNIYDVVIYYKLTGIALQYNFKIINSNTNEIYQELITPNPYFYGEVPFGDYTISVTLINGDFYRTVSISYSSVATELAAEDGSPYISESGDNIITQ